MADVPAIVARALLTAGIPIQGITFGDHANRATWAVHFDPSATPAQQAQAATILSTVAVDAAAQAAQDQKDAQSQIDALTIKDKSVFLTLLDEMNVLRTELNVLRAVVVPPLTPPLQPRTQAQAINAARQKAGTL